MALELSFTLSQTNDARRLDITDATGTGATGWGAPNEVVTDIVGSETTTASSHHLLLEITITDKNNVETTYDAINLYDLNDSGPFTTNADLTWSIYADDLVSDSTAMGTDEDRLIDGVWAITYTLQDANTGIAIDEYNAEVLVDGDARADVYDALREIAKQYDDNINDHIDEVMEALLKAAYLRAIHAAASVSEKQNLVNMLWTLDKLNSDGSKYDW